MLLPQTENFTAIVGGTFDPIITLYESLPQSSWRGDWSSSINYPTNVAVKGSNGAMYISLSQNVGNDPTTDITHWSTLPLFNLTGYTATFQIGTSLTLSVGSGVTLGGAAGTVAIVATASQTATFVVSRQHFYLQLTTPGGAVVFPLKGTVNFITP